ncbi:unnamed protein product [Rhizoctonia solani]|uniref:DUF6533 domain-containing protein n=1 Tax=Rhizoctonia solani TaxID=456999 RepID=A0A8H3CG12_9AGAM|nr:unnamed protein product [Rhizoctonia solani]
MASNLLAPAAAQLLTQAAIALKAATYLAVISLCLLIYDCVITIDQEVKFVWSQRWSFGKVVYLFIRYATILMMIGHVACIHVLNSPIAAVAAIFVWSQVVIIIAGSSVLVVRTWLLWGGARWVLAALIGGLILASALSIYYVNIDMERFSIITSVNPQLFHGCVVRIPPTVWRPFVSPLVYETFIIILTVVKVSLTPNRAPLVMRLLLDGTLYYVVVVAVLLLTTIGAAYAPTRPLVIGSGFHTACISIGCSRLVLSLHSWAYETKRRSLAHTSQHGANKLRLDHNSNSSLTTPFLKGSVSVQPQYELASWTAPDIESGKVMINPSANSNVSATALLLPQAAAPDVHSMLPDIEHPSLPERMWPKSSLTHTQHHQRPHRPPRSSSLYPAKPAFQRSQSAEQLMHVPQPQEIKWKINKNPVGGQSTAGFDSQKRYNVI